MAQFEKGSIPAGAFPFKPGQSGNPAGRPVGSRNRASVISELLSFPFEYRHPVSGELVQATIQDALVAAQVAKGLNGDLPAVAWLFDGLHGKVTAPVHVTSNGGSIIWNEQRTYALLDATDPTAD